MVSAFLPSLEAAHFDQKMNAFSRQNPFAFWAEYILEKCAYYSFLFFFFSNKNSVRFQVHICQAYTQTKTMSPNSALLKIMLVRLSQHIKVLTARKSFLPNLDTVSYNISKGKHHFCSQT